MQSVRASDPDVVISVEKEPAEIKVVQVDMTPITRGKTTVSSLGTVVFSPPESANKPTVVGSIIGGQIVQLVISAGLVAWNGSTGEGLVEVPCNLANSDTVELNVRVKVRNL